MSDSESTVINSLDVRSVAPRNRFEMIMGRYDDLDRGETLLLVVDHDPKCMYYTLKADYSDEAFAFALGGVGVVLVMYWVYVGWDVWQVKITKRTG